MFFFFSNNKNCCRRRFLSFRSIWDFLFFFSKNGKYAHAHTLTRTQITKPSNNDSVQNNNNGPMETLFFFFLGRLPSRRPVDPPHLPNWFFADIDRHSIYILTIIRGAGGGVVIIIITRTHASTKYGGNFIGRYPPSIKTFFFFNFFVWKFCHFFFWVVFKFLLFLPF